MRRRHLFGRIISLFLTSAMILSDAGVTGITAFADEVTDDYAIETEAVEIIDDVETEADEELTFDEAKTVEEITLDEAKTVDPDAMVAETSDIAETEEAEAVVTGEETGLKEAYPAPMYDDLTYGLDETLIEAVIEKDMAYLSKDAIGPDGVHYENVDYISNLAYVSLSPENRAHYMELCESVSSLIESGEEFKDITFAVNNEGNIEFQFTAYLKSVDERMAAMSEGVVEDVNGILTEDVADEILNEASPSPVTSEEVDASPTVSAEASESPSPTLEKEEEASPLATPSSTPDLDKEEEETSPSVTPSATPLLDKEDEQEDVSASPTPSTTPEEEGSDDELLEEEVSPSPLASEEVSVSPSPSALASSSPSPSAKSVELGEEALVFLEAFTELTHGDVVPNNVDIIEENSIEEYIIETAERIEFDTLINYQGKINYFYNQLKPDAKKAFEAGRSSMVNGSATSFTFSFPTYNMGSMWDNILDGTSALILTYTGKFGWMGCGSDGIVQASGSYTSSTANITVKLGKSRHYNAGLDSAGTIKARELVNEAYTYASKYYSSYITYGIIEYLDEWICKNNYYNYDGTYESKADTNTYYYCHSPYGTLTKGYGVCESFAKAMSKMLDYAGITNMYVVSIDHAFVYVQMPDNNWYMLDSTWNCPNYSADNKKGSKKTYLLSAKDNDMHHKPTGAMFDGGKQYWNFPALSSYKYTYTSENSNLNKTSLVLKKGATEQLSFGNSRYYNDFKISWTSDNPGVAKVVGGKVTAIAPGTATITCNIGNISRTCKVQVYAIGNLLFNENSKTTLVKGFENADTVFNTSDLQTLYLTLNCSGPLNAEQIHKNTSLAMPSATSSSVKVAEVKSVTLSGNTITLKVQPNTMGNAIITVKDAGKVAKLTLKVTQRIQTSWFDTSAIPTSVPYIAKAYKPAVTKTEAIPKATRYQVIYTNNVNAGKAKVTIKGLGAYSGTIEKEFTINPASVSTATVTSQASLTYAGKAVTPRVTSKLEKRALKVGKDFVILYKKTGTSTYTDAAPSAVGTYTVKIRGIGNYTGDSSASASFEIKKAPIGKVVVVCPTVVKYNNGSAVYPNFSVKIGTTVLSSSDYSVKYKDANGNFVASPKAQGRYKLVITPNTTKIEPTLLKTTIEKVFTVR